MRNVDFLYPFDVHFDVVLLTLSDDAVVLHYQHLSRNENVLHLLQQLWSEAGDGDLLCLHEWGEGRISVAGGVGQAPKHHRPNQRGRGAQGNDW